MKKGLSIKVKLLLTFLGTILIMLIFILFSSVHIVDIRFAKVKSNLEENIDGLSEDINKGLQSRSDEMIQAKQNEIDNILKNSNIMAKYALQKEIEALARKIKIIAEKNEIREAVINGLFRSGSLNKKTKSNRYIQEYEKSKSRLKYISLLNKQKTSGWPDKTNVSLEVFDEKGTVLARTRMHKKFKEKNNSKYIREILSTGMYAEINKVISNEQGIAVKVYSRISESFSKTKGGIIATRYFDNDFADMLKNQTGIDTIIYNKGKFLSSSFFDRNSRRVFRNRNDIFDKFKNGEISHVFENMKIQNSSSSEFYRIYYTPIQADNNEVIGIIGYCFPFTGYEVMKKQVLEEEIIMYRQFDNLLKHIYSDIDRDEKNLKKYFFISLALIILISSILFTIIFNILISKVVINTIKRVSNGLKELAEGKGRLGFLKIRSNDELGELTEHFNNFVDNLNFVVTEIKDGAMIIATSTMEINAGNRQLAIKANMQDESIKKTFQNINEIRDIVKKNAGITVIVNGMTNNAKKIAEEVGESARELNESMHRIKESSKQIEDILGVLNEITFQTKLLAINAAVESARAGKQGKGFSVVATEIKNLAVRSSDAAKQIKELIGENVDKVDAGDITAKRSNGNIEKIIEEVKNINNVIKGIAKLTETQNKETEEIIKEIKNIKDMIGENKLTAEEIFEMTEILNTKAFHFRKLVNFFAGDKIDGENELREIGNAEIKD